MSYRTPDGLAVDVAIFVRSKEYPFYPAEKILLIKRKNDPFKDMWALPGGFTEENESLEESARRELLEETGVTTSNLRQVQTYWEPGRDPRGWIPSVLYATWSVPPGNIKIKAGDDAKEAKLFDTETLFYKDREKSIEFAFDHELLFRRAYAFVVDNDPYFRRRDYDHE